MIDNDPLVSAVIEVESAGDVNAVSKCGAQGLMQLMPDTGREWHERLAIAEDYNPHDPVQNIRIGRAYLVWLLETFRDLRLALAAYNCGPGRVRRALKSARHLDWQLISAHLPRETREYVPKVLAAYKRYSSQADPGRTGPDLVQLALGRTNLAALSLVEESAGEGKKMNLFKRYMVAAFLPSNVVEYLKGNKRALGGVVLLLWVLIYGVPAVKPEWAFVADYAREVQRVLEAGGLDMSGELLAAGVGLSVIGLIDWVTGHITSDAAHAGLKAVKL